MANVATVDTAPVRVAPPPAATGLTGRARAERKLGLLLCAPAVVVMLFVAGFPIVYAFWLSLHRADLRFPSLDRWVGLDNYRSVLTSSSWWQNVANTLIITVCSVTIELRARDAHRSGDVSRDLRSDLDSGRRARALRAVTVVAAFAWRLAFDPATGFVPSLFNLSTPPLRPQRLVHRHHPLRGLEDDAVHRSASPRRTRVIPDDLYKAAKVDGATSLQRFWRITLPLIKPALMVALLFRTLDAFRIYDTVYIMTNGANNTGRSPCSAISQPVNRLNLGSRDRRSRC